MMRWISILALVVRALAAGECAPVLGDRITGRDLKAAGAGFDSAADDALVGLAPAPGARRVFKVRELARFGAADSDVCFERLAQPVSPEALETALRAAFAGRDLQLEIVEYSRTALPSGTLEFRLSGLQRPPASHPDTPVVWRGRLRYDGNRSAPVWATVRLAEQRDWIEAAERLAPGQPVRDPQLAVKSGRQFPLGPISATNARDFIGRLPRRTIAAGTVLATSMFEEAPVVAKGETVSVEVASGGVSLRFEGRAESAGRANDRILILDPARGHRMKAKVTGIGKVLIDAKENMAHTVVRAPGGGAAAGVE